MGSIIFAVMILILIYLLSTDKNRRSVPRNTTNYKPRSTFRPSKRDYEPAPSSYPRAKTKKSSGSYTYLIKLLNGDEDGAERLVKTNMLKFPEKDKQWHIEKAIDDILRDRR
jgi:hypothetical protein